MRDRGREGRNGPPMAQGQKGAQKKKKQERAGFGCWARKEIEKNFKRKAFSFLRLDNWIEFKSNLNLTPTNLALRSTKNKRFGMNATNKFLNLMVNFNLIKNYYLA